MRTIHSATAKPLANRRRRSRCVSASVSAQHPRDTPNRIPASHYDGVPHTHRRPRLCGLNVSHMSHVVVERCRQRRRVATSVRVWIGKIDCNRQPTSHSRRRRRDLAVHIASVQRERQNTAIDAQCSAVQTSADESKSCAVHHQTHRANTMATISRTRSRTHSCARCAVSAIYYVFMCGCATVLGRVKCDAYRVAFQLCAVVRRLWARFASAHRQIIVYTIRLVCLCCTSRSEFCKPLMNKRPNKRLVRTDNA